MGDDTAADWADLTAEDVAAIEAFRATMAAPENCPGQWVRFPPMPAGRVWGCGRCGSIVVRGHPLPSPVTH